MAQAEYRYQTTGYELSLTFVRGQRVWTPAVDR